MAGIVPHWVRGFLGRNLHWVWIFPIAIFDYQRTYCILMWYLLSLHLTCIYIPSYIPLWHSSMKQRLCIFWFIAKCCDLHPLYDDPQTRLSSLGRSEHINRTNKIRQDIKPKPDAWKTLKHHIFLTDVYQCITIFPYETLLKWSGPAQRGGAS